jgi:ribosome-binding factor A
LIHDIHDPDLGFVTVTRIEMTPDLRFARVFYSILGSAEKKIAAEKVLKENARFIRRLAAERINMKYAIEIRFVEDPSIEESFRLDEILKKIRKKEDGKG